MHSKVTLPILLAVSLNCPVFASESLPNEISVVSSPLKPATNNMPAFTGKIIKNKVRMRLGPTLDTAILKELNKGDLLVVVGETDEFFAVQPPEDIKGFIFRTFVLDNKVEGNRVNIRLAPSTDSAVIGQLNSGDTVHGSISQLNNKWIEIPLPSSTRFYIAKEYIENVGDRNYLALVSKRRDEVNNLLQSSILLTQQELQKSFPDIRLDTIVSNYEKIAKDYSDFPSQATRSQELLAELNEKFLHKKIDYLEWLTSNRQNSNITEAPMLQAAAVETLAFPPAAMHPEELAERQLFWKSAEKSLYEEWALANSGSMEEFYSVQKQNSAVLTGILQPYQRSVKNKPGDYILVHPETKTPIAYIYSTFIDLQDKVQQEVTFELTPRTNNHFAYPAYFALSVK